MTPCWLWITSFSPHTWPAHTYETAHAPRAAAAENVQRVAKGGEPLYVVT